MRSLRISTLRLAPAALCALLSTLPATTQAAKDQRIPGRLCSWKFDATQFRMQPPPTGTFLCPWLDSSDFRAASIAELDIELDVNVQGNAKACVDYWNANGGECGPAMGNTKTLKPLLDAWGWQNYGHFTYLAGTFKIPGLTNTGYTGQPIKGIFGYIP